MLGFCGFLLGGEDVKVGANATTIDLMTYVKADSSVLARRLAS